MYIWLTHLKIKHMYVQTLFATLSDPLSLYWNAGYFYLDYFDSLTLLDSNTNFELSLTFHFFQLDGCVI